jgi:hypothetical protein
MTLKRYFGVKIADRLTNSSLLERNSDRIKKFPEDEELAVKF